MTNHEHDRIRIYHRNRARQHARAKKRRKNTGPQSYVHHWKDIAKRVPGVQNTALGEYPALFGSFTGKLLLSPGENIGLFSLIRTFWVFLSQVLSANKSCQEAVAKALAWIAVELSEVLNPSTSAYCQARARLTEVWLVKIFDEIRDNVQAGIQESLLWYGRVVKIIDGSCTSMPDTKANQAKYPQPDSQKPGCGFLVMRLVVCFSLASGAVLDWAWGSLKDHERLLFKQLWKNLKAGEVVLCDRGFCSFADIYLLQQRQIDCVMRLHQRRSAGVKETKRLGKGDQLVEWTRSGPCPKWLEQELWDAMPRHMLVRHICFDVEIPGFRSQHITLVTTLLDKQLFPAIAFVQLYRWRWLCELFLRDMKVSMGMEPLRCKSPGMIQKEVIMHFIAYNLLRGLMLKAAQRYALRAVCLSFKYCMAFVRQWASIITMCREKAARENMVELLLEYLVQQVLPDRPDRTEPRAVKRRPKNYQLLNKPRQEFKEVQHRNRYTCKAA